MTVHLQDSVGWFAVIPPLQGGVRTIVSARKKNGMENGCFLHFSDLFVSVEGQSELGDDFHGRQPADADVLPATVHCGICGAGHARRGEFFPP
jgi:hypothetical protein